MITDKNKFIFLILIIIYISLKIKYLKIGFLRKISIESIKENNWDKGNYYYPCFHLLSSDIYFNPENGENLEMRFFNNSSEQSWDITIIDENYKRLSSHHRPKSLCIYHQDYNTRIIILIKYDENYNFKYDFKLSKKSKMKRIKDDVINISDEDLHMDLKNMSDILIKEMEKNRYNLYLIKNSKYFYSYPMGGVSYKTKISVKKGDAVIIICSDKNKILNIKHKIDIYNNNGDLLEFFHEGKDLISKCVIYIDADEKFNIIEKLPYIDEKSNIKGFKVLLFSKY